MLPSCALCIRKGAVKLAMGLGLAGEGRVG